MRVGLSHAPQPTLEGLRTLHRAQLFTIPFENFDILLGRGIDVSQDAIFEKTLNKRRGGYCFELNELLFAALQSFGFTARRILARVHLGPSPSALTHQSTLVTINGTDYLVDAGFGGQTPRCALPFLPNKITASEKWRYRIVEAPPYGHMVQDWFENNWRNLYSFDGRPVLEIDRVMGSHMTSTHPLSFFTFGPRASLFRPDGRVALFEHRFIREIGDTTQEIDIPPGAPYLDLLRHEFGLDLDAPYEAIKPLHSPPSAV